LQQGDEIGTLRAVVDDAELPLRVVLAANGVERLAQVARSVR